MRQANHNSAMVYKWRCRQYSCFWNFVVCMTRVQCLPKSALELDHMHDKSAVSAQECFGTGSHAWQECSVCPRVLWNWITCMTRVQCLPKSALELDHMHDKSAVSAQECFGTGSHVWQECSVCPRVLWNWITCMTRVQCLLKSALELDHMHDKSAVSAQECFGTGSHAWQECSVCPRVLWNWITCMTRVQCLPKSALELDHNYVWQERSVCPRVLWNLIICMTRMQWVCSRAVWNLITCMTRVQWVCPRAENRAI